jgi:excisionase family DNA binding protein
VSQCLIAPGDPVPPRLALNQAEAARALGVSVPTFRTEVRPKLRRVMVGRRMLFPVTELQRWLDEHARSAAD